MTETFLTIPEVAQLLRISLRKAYQLAEEGKLPGTIKVGVQWRVNREQLMAWNVVAPEKDAKAKAKPRTKKGTAC